jgi:hypothetical protein
LDGEEINVIVNHCRHAPVEKKSSPFEALGALNRKIIDSLQRINQTRKGVDHGRFK